MHNFLSTFPSNHHQHKSSGCHHRNRSFFSIRLFPSTSHFPTLLIVLLAILMVSPIQCSPPFWLINGDGGNDQFMGQSNFGANRHRRLFRLAEFVQPSSIGRQFYSQNGQQSSAKRQMKDSSSSMSGFAKMDALKNNMMRALINLRRYRRAKSEDWTN